MSAAAPITANRLNAQDSTGPGTGSDHELCATTGAVNPPSATPAVFGFEHGRGEANTSHYLLIIGFFPHFPAVSRTGDLRKGLHPVVLEAIKWLLRSGKRTQSLFPCLRKLLFKNAQIPVDFRISYAGFPSRRSAPQAGSDPKNPEAEPNPKP